MCCLFVKNKNKLKINFFKFCTLNWGLQININVQCFWKMLKIPKIKKNQKSKLCLPYFLAS